MNETDLMTLSPCVNDLILISRCANNPTGMSPLVIMTNAMHTDTYYVKYMRNISVDSLTNRSAKMPVQMKCLIQMTVLPETFVEIHNYA